MNQLAAQVQAFFARDPTRRVPLFIVLAGVGAVSFAYAAQYGFGLEPCVLCLYQRGPYALAAGLAGIILLKPRNPRREAFIVALCGLVFLAGAGLASYHVGVEQHWWTSVAACGGGPVETMGVEDLKALLTKKPEKACDVVDWTFLGVSMATYNVFASLALAFASLAGARMIRRLDPT
jgi:disulfide bond formation protein DsbB